MTAPPLAGLRVLELAEGVAGPMVARLLGDAGADVIKLELAEGDRARGWVPQVDGVGAVFATLNRNKRSVRVGPSPSSMVAELAACADVVVVDDELADRCAVDLAALMDHNDRLVVCVISGWGPDGPWSQRVGGELPAQLAAEATSSLGRPGDEPVRLGTDHASVACALYGFQAVTAALLVADDGGQRIDVSLFGSVMHMRTALWVALSNPDEWWGFHLDSYTKPPEHYYTCKDRRVSVQAVTVRDRVALVKDLEMEWVLDDPRWPMFAQDSGPLGRYGAQVHDLWDRGLSRWTFAEALEIFQRHGGTLYPCNAYADFLADPQVQHLGLVIDADDETESAMPEIRPPWQLSTTPASVRSPAPTLGEHGDDVQTEILGPRDWGVRDP
jgi:crotonobetainyl-CoA:carnitine CoA-transferase CaiB-like acyl-CoA transferase